MQKEEQHVVTGLLIGLTTCNHGGTHVTLDINGQKLHLSPNQAELAMDTIYQHLLAIGYYGEESEDLGIVEVRRGTH